MREFNTTAVCIPSKHYMVDLSERLAQIKEKVDSGKYFTINRARQYGKTTTINALRQYLADEYEVLSLSFEGISQEGFKNEQAFVKAFCRKIKRLCRTGKILPVNIKDQIDDFISRKTEKAGLDELFDTFLNWCEESDKGIVLIIDEVDSATNNQVFLDFLAQLRDSYIARDTEGLKTFHSVILAGVTDVKHLKSKIRPDEEKQVNSPWNIAADFTIDMSLSEKGIKGMLQEYEADHHTGMDIAAAAKLIRDYTSGYPFLVSRICQLIDIYILKTLSPGEAWSRRGIDESVKMILAEDNTLFQSISKNLNNNPALKKSIRSILMEGTRIAWNPDQDDIALLQMHGLIQNDEGLIRISNRIFETRLYNFFLSEEEFKSNIFYRTGELEKNIFVSDGRLNVRMILEHFIDTWHQIYGPLADRFKEKDGREYFLLYLKPIINGTGNYYIEAQTRDQRRTDVIIDYLGHQYIIELKIWRGERYHADGEKQIMEYLNYYNLTTGYMLSFNFHKKKETGLQMVHIADKLLYEATL